MHANVGPTRRLKGGLGDPPLVPPLGGPPLSPNPSKPLLPPLFGRLPPHLLDGPFIILQLPTPLTCGLATYVDFGMVTLRLEIIVYII